MASPGSPSSSRTSNATGTWRVPPCLAARIAGVFLFFLGAVSQARDTIDIHQAVALARSGNPDYLKLLDEVTRADLDLEQARAAFRTRIHSNLSSESRLGSEFGSTYSLGISRRLRSGSRIETDFITSDFSNTTLSELRLRYTRPLFADPERSGLIGLRDAEAHARQARRLRTVGEEVLIEQVIRAFYEAYRRHEAVALQRRLVHLADRTLEAVQLRHDRGLADAFELANAALERDRATDRLHELEDALEEQFEAMRLLIGQPVDADVEFDLDLPLDVEFEPETTLESLQTEALATRPEVLAARELREAALERMRRLSRKAVPPIDVSLQYSLTGQGSDLAESLRLNDQRVGLGLTMNTDFGLTDARNARERAALAYREATRRLEQIENRIRSEVRKAYRKVLRSRDRQAIAERQTQLARSRYEAERARYERGLADTVDLLQAQQALSEARHQALGNRIDVLLAQLALDTLTGRLHRRWQALFTE